MVFQRVEHGLAVRNIWETVVDIGWMAFRMGFDALNGPKMKGIKHV